MNYSKGISWIDDCRIPFVDEGENTIRKQTPISIHIYQWKNHKGFIGSFDDSAKQGRFPANILCSDDVLNDGSISNGNKPSKRNKNHRYSMDYGLKVFEGMDITGYSDKGTNSRYYDIDKWFDKILNEL